MLNPPNAAPVRVSKKRVRQEVCTLSVKKRVIQYMAQQVAAGHSRTAVVLSTLESQGDAFPHKGNEAERKRCMRWFKGIDESKTFFADKRNKLAFTTIHKGVRHVASKKVMKKGRGRKRASWCVWLCSQLITEYDR